jgi:hypothetical protein
LKAEQNHTCRLIHEPITKHGAKCDKKCGLKKGLAFMQLDWTGQNSSKRFPIIEREEKGTRSGWQDFVLYHQDLKQV